MLYPTLNQPFVFFVIALAGLASGLTFDLANLFAVLCNRNKIGRQILYFLATVLSVLILFFTNLYANFGQFRVFVVLSFLFVLIIERFTLGVLLNKVFNKISGLRINLNFRKKKNSSIDVLGDHTNTTEN